MVINHSPLDRYKYYIQIEHKKPLPAESGDGYFRLKALWLSFLDSSRRYHVWQLSLQKNLPPALSALFSMTCLWHILFPQTLFRIVTLVAESLGSPPLAV